ncbi:hypothetical protein L6452_30222 [Arctium lappa]|uniref:Uncharacterized protein n=1 Tax=Arctium lappa TaxID=4217 RepID=A0ACB8ZIY2_ARCLA|nr:hypothetical protein L6452_30222 [Arctium lappa]
MEDENHLETDGDRGGGGGDGVDEGDDDTYLIQKDSWRTSLLLGYKSLGVVYGDLNISPLYVYRTTFTEDIHNSETNEEIFGVLSSVFSGL